MRDAARERLRRNIRELARQLAASPEGLSADPSPGLAGRGTALSVPIVTGGAEANARPSGGKAAVVCWDLAHNPAGRAFVLARLLAEDWKVQMIGPLWPRFGINVWLPIRHEPIDYRTFTADGLPTIWREAYRIALAEKFDLVVVSKPRLPGLLIGLALAEQSRCPLIFDFDEDERAFAAHHQSQDAGALLKEPFGEAGIALTAECWGAAGAYTVSNRAISVDGPSRVVRHARDEGIAIPDRDEARRALGLAPDDFVMAFVGTVRGHKGLAAVFDTLEAIPSPRLKLLIAGVVADPVSAARIAHLRGERVLQHPPGSIKDLGRYLAAADVVPLLQDEASAITGSQLPAKLTDALQHGVRVVASGVPPLREVSRDGVIDVIEPSRLTDWVSAAMAASGAAASRAAARDYFLDEFSFEVNRARLSGAVRTATARLEHSLAAVPATLNVIRQATHAALAAVSGGGFGRTSTVRPVAAHDSPASAADAEIAPSTLPEEAVSANVPATDSAGTPLDELTESIATSPELHSAVSDRDEDATGAFHVAFFWKQNDSDIYGRRSDMLAKQFSVEPKVGALVHFDHPLTRRTLIARAEQRDPSSAHALIFERTISRVLRLADAPRFGRRTRIEADARDPQTIGGIALAPVAADAAFVVEQLRDAGLEPGTTIAWVCPLVRGIDLILDTVPFRAVVVDLIDDQREWASDRARREELTAAYRAVLARADVVFTNCEENRARFADIANEINVVPNGAETDPPQAEPPEWLLSLPRPRIGYVGNLADRIDWDLLVALARLHPDWSFPIIGDHGRNGLPEAATAVPNLVFPGVLPYETARAAMRAFDAAIVPHVVNGMTEVMNPLKVYNYLAAGLPVVGTEAARVPDAQHLVTFASNAIGFSEALTRCLAARRVPDPGEVERFSWATRMRVIMERLHPLVDRSPAGPTVATDAIPVG